MTMTSTAGCCGGWRITPQIARRGSGHGSDLGKLRRVVERAFSWLHNFRRLRTRYERRAGIHPSHDQRRLLRDLPTTPTQHIQT